MSGRRRVALAAGALGLTLAALGGFAGAQMALPHHPLGGPTPAEMLTQPIPDSAPNAAQLRQGQYLVRAGDCVSCHMRPGGAPLAGGLGLKTPFGVIFSSNITPDAETGIGRWTPDQFYAAMHDGHGARGENLYPAFPYPWFRRMSRADDDAVLAYLKSTPPVRYSPPGNRLPFPLNLRFMVKGWNLLFLKSHDFQPDPGQSAEWNRGAYLVNGPGHCGGCHTPKNLLGADKGGQDFRGGVLDNWTAPDLTANPRTGLGAWSVDDVAHFLKTGRNAHANAGGAMADVVSWSTSLMDDADLRAIAVYLKSRPAAPEGAAGQADPAALKRGAQIYSDACASCHLENGVGQPGYIPPLGRNAVVQQGDATGLTHLILAGSRTAPTPTYPSPLTMPAFAWKLSDREIADVATYVRQSWGNGAAPVPAGKVGKLRRALGLDKPQLTENSGDQNRDGGGR
ncbi:c-type cytochrome [Caulobacter sp. KR2-114]|uniref:c-type cytochrome n=1 Tax=Caulobacter sp. KR2-114 TaxID=3400912 RepID=UPI003C061D4F